MFKAIPKPNLDRLLPNNPAVENLIESGLEWFSNRSGNVLGTIANGDSMAKPGGGRLARSASEGDRQVPTRRPTRTSRPPSSKARRWT